MSLDEYRVPMRRYAADEIFGLFVRSLHTSGRRDFAAMLTPEVSVLALRRKLSATDYHDLGKLLNGWFGIAVQKREWYRAIYPERRHTVGELCEFIARHAVVPVIEPIEVWGDASKAAGAFMALRELFAAEGADVSEIHPTALLGPYLRKHVPVLNRIGNLTPGRLPPVHVEAPVHLGLWVAMMLCLAAAAAGHCCGILPGMTGWFFAAELLLSGVLFIANKLLRPANISLGNLRTFRDLSLMITGQRTGDAPGFPLD